MIAQQAASVELAPNSNTDNGNYGAYHEWRYLVADELRKLGYDKQADKYESCSCDQAVKFWSSKQRLSPGATGALVCPSNPDHSVQAVFRTCQNPICPDCARRKTAQYLHRFMTRVRELNTNQINFGYRFKHIVLTTPIDVWSEDAKFQALRLKTLIPQMFDLLAVRGWLRKDWRKSQGFIRAGEFGEEGDKLHFHIFFYGQFISNKKDDGYPLATAWRDVTGGDCKVTWIGAIKPGKVESRAVEVLKYAVKLWSKDDNGNLERLDPALAARIYEIFKGTRRIEGYGVFYKLPPVPPKERKCEHCNATLEFWWASDFDWWQETGDSPGALLKFKLALNFSGSDPPDRGKPPGYVADLPPRYLPDPADAHLPQIVQRLIPNPACTGDAVMPETEKSAQRSLFDEE